MTNMRTSAASVLWCLVIVVSVVAMPVAAGAGPATSSATASVDGQSATSQESETETAVVASELRQADGTRLFLVELSGPSRTELERSAQPFETMQAQTREASKPVQQVIRSDSSLNLVRRFNVGNMLLVEGPTDGPTLDRLAETPTVQRLLPNFEVSSPQPGSGSAPAPSANGTATTYGLEQIDAVEAWEQFDTRGGNASVAVLDTGVNASHPDIDLYTENESDPTYPGGWAEFNGSGVQLDSTPRDDDTHGTHTSGTVSGGKASGEHIGVAPNVDLMHGMVLGERGGTFAAVLAGMDWAAQQDADVVSMSLGAPGYLSATIEPVRNLRAAGVFVVVSSGNEGVGVTGSPGNVYESLAVGATNENRAVSTFSSGTVVNTTQAWGEDAPEEWPDAYTIPDVSAPGVGVKSAVPGSEYDTKSGTSMAAPHVAGVVGLMRSVAPNATPDEMEAALKRTATQPDDAPITQDIRYGTGIVDADAAISAVADESSIEGTVTNDGEPVADATVQLADGPRVRTDEDGSFSLPAEPGQQELTVTRFGFETVTRTVTVEANETTTVELSTEPTVDARVLEPQSDAVAAGGTANLTVAITNAEQLTIELTGNYSPQDVTLRAGGQEVPLGEPIPLDGSRATASLTVETTAGATGSFSLEHTLAGTVRNLTVTTGPTTVTDDLVDVALVDRADAENAALVSKLETVLPPQYEIETVAATDAPDAVGQYDAFVARNVSDATTAGEFMETATAANAGVVLLGQIGDGTPAIKQVSEATGWPDSVGSESQGSRPVTYELTADHPIVDSVGDPGETVTLHNGWFPGRSWVQGVDNATVLANTSDGEATNGAGLVVDEERNTVLAASLGTVEAGENGEFDVPISRYTDTANVVLANAIEHVAANSDQAEGPAITLEDETVTSGENTTVTLGTDAKNVAGYQANISFDPEVVQVASVQGANFRDPLVNVDNDAGYVSIAQAGTTAVDQPDLAELTFETVGDRGQSTTLSLSPERSLVNDPNGETIRTTTRDGSVQIAPCPTGDANGDGAVTSGDATLVLRHIVGDDIDATFYENCADVNGDDEITSGDATGILQRIVGAA